MAAGGRVIAALLAEGSSDKALLPIVRWVLANATPVEVRVEWIDTTSFRTRATSLRDKVEAARLVCHCDLLFVHRDADNQPPEWRNVEIADALGDQVHVAVVPIRTTEAWLLIDTKMIRAAAGRPSGTENLGLPPVGKIEDESDPKTLLREALRRAHGATGRRAQRFDTPMAVNRLANLIEDWTPLRRFRAFQRVEQDTRSALGTLGLTLHPATT
jgi:hypothetical protein